MPTTPGRAHASQTYPTCWPFPISRSNTAKTRARRSPPCSMMPSRIRGGEETREEIRRRFGDRVVEIVESCTDTDATPKPPWRPQKEAYLAYLRTAPLRSLDLGSSQVAERPDDLGGLLRDRGISVEAVQRRKGRNASVLILARHGIPGSRDGSESPRRRTESGRF